MSIPRRTFDRTLVAKLSDARERLHDLVERGADERADEASAGGAWPRDITDPDLEVPRG
jgi:hypothetical protein